MSWIVRLEVSADEAEFVASELWDAGTNGVAELGESDDTPSDQPTSNATSTTTTLLAGFPDLAAAQSAAARFDGFVEPVSTADWAVTESSVVEVAGATLTLEVGTAFGHGAHPTTRLALEALDELTTNGELGTVLDIGTGTGVLALGAARLGASSITGLDIDADAVEIARRNVATNRSVVGSSPIELVCGELEVVPGQFDTVVANMLLADLRPLAPLIAARVSGTLIVSGFLTDQVDEMRDLFALLAVVHHHHDDGWAMLRFARDHI